MHLQSKGFICSLDYDNKHYQRRKSDLEDQLYKTYGKIEEMEVSFISAKANRHSILAEKRELFSQVIESVEIYKERQTGSG